MSKLLLVFIAAHVLVLVGLEILMLENGVNMLSVALKGLQ